jgi:hypothetical protein
MRDSNSPCTSFDFESHVATLRWSGGQHTLTILYDGATTLQFTRAYRDPAKSTEAIATHFSVPQPEP